MRIWIDLFSPPISTIQGPWSQNILIFKIQKDCSWEANQISSMYPKRTRPRIHRLGWGRDQTDKPLHSDSPGQLQKVLLLEIKESFGVLVFRFKKKWDYFQVPCEGWRYYYSHYYPDSTDGETRLGAVRIHLRPCTELQLCLLAFSSNLRSLGLISSY